MPRRELTEMRGLDEIEDRDWPVHDRTIISKGGRYVSQRELEERPIERASDDSRCWCGRPIMLSGTCREEHVIR